MPAIIRECAKYLRLNATGAWHETFRFKDVDTGEYLHPVSRELILLRVETESKRRAFYWIYNPQDAIRFNQFVGLQLNAEAHEILITPRCRMFYDIDMKLDEIQKNELVENMGFTLSPDNEIDVMDIVGKKLAGIFKESTLISLEDHGIDLESDLVGFDWLFTMRNRAIAYDGFKISIHLVTNLVLPLAACSAIASDVKLHAIRNNTAVLDISTDVADLLSESIDEMQYRKHGSLSLPFGTKVCTSGRSTNWIYQEYSIPGQYFFITAEDRFSITQLDMSGYNIQDTAGMATIEASPEFVEEALRHVHNIKDYDPRVWDIGASTLRKSTMYVKRYAPSYCSTCLRTHDNDNTLFLIFNSEKGIASWKCTRSPHIKATVFYQDPVNDSSTISVDDLDAFASKRSTPIPRRARADSDIVYYEESIDDGFDLEAFASKRVASIAKNFTDIEDPFMGDMRPSRDPSPNSQQDLHPSTHSWIEAFIAIRSEMPAIPEYAPDDPFDIAPRKSSRRKFECAGPIIQHKVLETADHISGDEKSDSEDEIATKPSATRASRGVRRISARRARM
jgi:hypothetical protein